jgi:Domain of unknown function (DUF4272)
MENCTIYSHNLEFEKVVQIVKSSLPKAEITFDDNGINKSLVASIKGGLFSKAKTLKINYRQRENPSYKLEAVECGLTQNLAGMVNFIQSVPSANPSVRDRFLYKVMSANCEIPFMVEPEFNADFESILKKIVFELDAFVFAQPNRVFNKSNTQHFTDKNLNLVLDMNGNCEVQDIEVNVDAKYHDKTTEYSPEQLERKAISEATLNQFGVKINKNLPCIDASTEIIIREKHEIINRAYALLTIAAKGEGVEQEYLDRNVQEKNINSFSPVESQIYKAANLNDQERAYATWRYESLNVMLWALGKVDTLVYLNEICNVSEIVTAIFQPTREAFKNSVTLRNTSEILEELDKIYRMNWACVDARIKNQPTTGNLDASIVYERHYSLNWLTQYQNQDWDDVQTNT